MRVSMIGNFEQYTRSKAKCVELDKQRKQKETIHGLITNTTFTSSPNIHHESK